MLIILIVIMFVLFIASAPAVIAPVVQDLISLEYVTLTILTPPPLYIYISYCS